MKVFNIRCTICGFNEFHALFSFIFGITTERGSRISDVLFGFPERGALIHAFVTDITNFIHFEIAIRRGC